MSLLENMSLLVKQETNSGISLGWFLRWVYPIKPSGCFWV